jgi:hypothetical protein
VCDLPSIDRPDGKPRRYPESAVIQRETLGGADAKTCPNGLARSREWIKREFRRGQEGG